MRPQKLSFHPNIEFQSPVGSQLQHLSSAQSPTPLGFQFRHSNTTVNKSIVGENNLPQIDDVHIYMLNS